MKNVLIYDRFQLANPVLTALERYRVSSVVVTTDEALQQTMAQRGDTLDVLVYTTLFEDEDYGVLRALRQRYWRLECVLVAERLDFSSAYRFVSLGLYAMYATVGGLADVCVDCDMIVTRNAHRPPQLAARIAHTRDLEVVAALYAQDMGKEVRRVSVPALVSRFDAQLGDLAGLAVLVVEDRALYNRQVCAWLEGEGMTVVGAYSAQEALAILAQQSFAVVLLDIDLVDEAGMELVPFIHQGHDASVVIMLTALIDMEACLHCINVGAADYILKTVLPAELKVRIKRALVHRRVRAMLARG